MPIKEFEHGPGMLFTSTDGIKWEPLGETLGGTLEYDVSAYEPCEGKTFTTSLEPVEIEKVNTGFMAVPIEAGSNNVIFTYETPGLKLGCLIAGGALGIFVIYLAVSFVMSRKEGRK